MAGKGTLTVRVVGDSTKFNKTMGEVEGRLGKVAGGIAKVGKIVAVGSAAAAGGAVLLGKEVLGTGAKLEGWRKKTSTVFEGSAGDIRKWADKNNEVFGLTDDQLTGLAANFGDLLKPMGFTADQAGKMAKDVVGLSGALSEWTGGTRSAADVSNILSKAMLGEREGLKELGISITEADVSARLATKGQEGLTGAALQQAKALATQELIFEKSTDAQAAFADGGNKALRSQNKLKAGIAELREQLSDKLLPVFQGALSFLTDRLVPGVESLIKTFQEEGLGGVVDKVKEKFGELWPGIQEKLGEVIAGVVEWLAENGPKIAEQLVEWGKALIEWIGPQIPPLLVELGKFLGKALEWILTDGVPKLVEALLDMAAALIEWIAPAIPPMLLELGKLLVDLLDWVVTDALPKLITEIAKWGAEFVAWVVPAAGGLLLELPKLYVKMAGWVGEKAIELGTKLLEWAGEFVGWVATAIRDLPGKLEELAGKIIGFVGGMPSRIATAASGMWDGIKDAFRGAVNWIIDKWNGLKLTLGGQRVDLPFGMGFSIPGITLRTPNIPRLNKGAVNFDGGLAYVHKGEVLANLAPGTDVIPKHKVGAMGGGGDTYIINMSTTFGDRQSMKRAAEELRRELLHTQRRNPGLGFT